LDQDDQWCSTFYEFKTLFEFYDRDLEQELRIKDKMEETDEFTKYFFEPEIWYIFDSLVVLEKSFYDKGYVHGDMQPKTLHIDPNGFIKVLDITLINPGHNGYKKVFFNKDYTAALSPQQLDYLREGVENPHYDETKSEVWSIGLTTLCASLNRNVDDFYNWKKYEVKWDILKSSYEHMREIGYSEQLISTIQQCLEVDESRRTTLNNIIEFLAPYQDQIRKGQHSFGFFHDKEADVLLQPKVHDVVEVHQQKPQHVYVQNHQPQHYQQQSQVYEQRQVNSIPERREVAYTQYQPQVYTTTVGGNRNSTSRRQSYVTKQNEPVRYTGGSYTQSNQMIVGGGNPLSTGIQGGGSRVMVNPGTVSYGSMNQGS